MSRPRAHAKIPRRSCALLVFGLVLAQATVTNYAAVDNLDRTDASRWRALASLPDREGLAGPFAGVSGGALLVAGGANFPGMKPWEGGTKTWHDTVFVLDGPDSFWRVAGKLPHPLAYGVSVTTSDGVLCAGGSDGSRHFAESFLLQWTDGKLRRRKMPRLPRPSANLCGALVGHILYLAGGTESHEAPNAMNVFWALDLSARRLRWEALETWPGPARMLAVAGAHEGSFYLFSGVELRSGASGTPVRNYLRDAYCFTPARRWRRLPDLPRAAAAAPSPAPLVGSELLVVSGDDGTQVNFEPMSAHPGFPRDVLSYNLLSNTWTRLKESPLSRATVPTAEWRDLVVIPNGETRPGVRTPEVWSLAMPNRNP